MLLLTYFCHGFCCATMWSSAALMNWRSYSFWFLSFQALFILFAIVFETWTKSFWFVHCFMSVCNVLCVCMYVMYVHTYIHIFCLPLLTVGSVWAMSHCVHRTIQWSTSIKSNNLMEIHLKIQVIKWNLTNK